MKLSILIKAAAILLLLASGAAGNPIWLHWGVLDTIAPARYDFGAAYFVPDHNIVLFGGIDSSGQMPGDTWEWNGDSWRQVDATGPAGRRGFGMCYDSGRELIILYGGQSAMGEYLEDTWVWDGSVWTELSVSGPPARADFVMAYDYGSDNVILFGGSNGDSVFNDSWQWDGTRWSSLDIPGPSARVYSQMAANPRAGNCILFGGLSDYDGEVLGDCWAFDDSSWTQIQGEGPAPRFGHMMGYTVNWPYYDGIVIVYGGRGGSDFNEYYSDCWELGNDGWTLFDSPEAWPRSFGKIVEVPYLDMALFGGRTGSQIFHDMWGYPIPVCSNYVVGDVNVSGAFDGMDVVYSVAYFKGGHAPPNKCECPPGNPIWYASGDVNASCSFNGLDITYMVAYFKGGPVLRPCPICPPAR